jgi:hypothetical protein
VQKQNLRNFAVFGYLLDLFKIAKFEFQNPHSLTKFFLIKSIQKRKGLTCFIETGTYLGVTTKRCAQIFDQVYTVELSEELAEKAANFLARDRHVKVICADALEALPKVLEDEAVKNAFVFLDGHFSGGVTESTDVPEPAIEELKVLAKHKDKIGAIMIDDFRSFGKEPGFPYKSELLKAAESYFDGFEISVHLDQLLIIATH